MYEILQQVLTYLRSMWRYRWYAMLLSWAIAVGGWAYVYTLPNIYTSSARVHVDTESVLRPLMRGLTIQPDLRQRLSLMTRTLLSRPNMEKLARMTDMDINSTTPAQMDDMLNRLANDIVLRGSGRNVNIYHIQYSSSNRERAKAIVQNLITILMETTLGQSRENRSTAQRFLRRQLEQHEARLSEAEEELQKFKRENAELMPTLRDGYFQSLQNTKRQLAEAKLQLEEATRRRNELRRQLAGEEPVFGIAPDSSMGKSAAASPLAQRIQSLEEQRDELLLQFTEKHPKVISINETIEALREQQRAETEAYAEASDNKNVPDTRPLETNPVYQQLRIALAQTEAEVSGLSVRVKEYRRKVEELDRRVDQIPEIEGELNRLQQNYEIAQKKYNEFREREETATLSEKVEEAGEGLRIEVIDPPTVPNTPSGPDRLLLNSAALVLALGAGIALSFVLSQLKPVVHDTKTLQAVTGLPIFGNISRVWTTELLRAKRIEYGGFAVVGMMLIGAYASLVVFYVR